MSWLWRGQSARTVRPVVVNKGILYISLYANVYALLLRQMKQRRAQKSSTPPYLLNTKWHIFHPLVGRLLSHNHSHWWVHSSCVGEFCRFPCRSTTMLFTLHQPANMSSKEPLKIAAWLMQNTRISSINIICGGDASVCSIVSVGSVLEDDVHDDGAIIGFSDELLSERATEWQEVSVGVSLADEDVQRMVFDALFDALTECVDKSAKRLKVIESQLEACVQDIAAKYSNNRPFYNFRSAAEILLRADFLWERHSKYERHDPWDRFILLFSAL
eukprot:scaffold1834_cov101-Cylindrotheca_fusiformis.AAC.1